MTRFSPPNQAPEPFLRTLRALVETNALVLGASNRHVESLGLTPAQFDVLATLGDTPGMTCKDLGERTLITKGTLTGVLDRLEGRGLVQRTRSEDDCRQIFVSLTPEGEAIFEQTFQPQVDYMAQYFNQMSAERQTQLVELLQELHSIFS